MVNRFSFKCLFTSFFLVTGLSCIEKQTSSIYLNPEPLNEILNRYVEDEIWPFLYSKIVDGKSGDIVYEHLAINKRLLPNQNIDGSTWMRIWSMSKLVTISIAMDLMEEGLFYFDDPVHKYIPEFSKLMVVVDNNGESISSLRKEDLGCPHNLVKMDSVMTVQHLFNHTAGFYYALTPSECLNDSLAIKRILQAENGDQLIDILSTLPLVQQPGQRYFYGMNTSVLGLLLERVTGKSLYQNLKERVTKVHNIEGLAYTKPQGIELIPTFTGREGNLRKIIDGELDIFGGEVPNYSRDNNLFLGGEGMLGTADGYIRFMQLLFFNDGNTFLKKETIQKMSSKPNVEENNYGYNTGFGMYLTSRNHAFEKDILRVGGYEKTKCWVDRKNNLIGTLFSQANETQDSDGLSNQMEQDFKKELFSQLNQ